MTQNTSHNVWQYAFNHNPILDHSDYDLSCPARLADSVETYLIHETGEVSVRLAMGASKLLSYYCDDNNSGSFAMSAQFADYRTAFNGWIKNVALNAPMGHAAFNPGLDGTVCQLLDGTFCYDTADYDRTFLPDEDEDEDEDEDDNNWDTDYQTDFDRVDDYAALNNASYDMADNFRSGY